MALPGLAPPKPIPLKDRSSILFVGRGQIDVLDGGFVVIDAEGVRTREGLEPWVRRGVAYARSLPSK